MGTTTYRAAAAALTGLLGACSLIPGTTAALEREARDKLEGVLLDADSARFRGVRAVTSTSGVKPERLVCGEVNAKNRMGAYSGFARFIVSRDDTFAVTEAGRAPIAEPETDAQVKEAAYQDAFDGTWKEACVSR